MAAGGVKKSITAIVTDPSAPPEVRILRGFVGASATEKHTRLYMTPVLSHWWDIPDEAILQRLPVDGDEFGAELLWVDRGAVITQSGHKVSQVTAKFLSGEIAQQHVKEAEGASTPKAVPPSYYGSCASMCESWDGYCAAASPPSYDGGCSSQCKTVAGYCAAAGPPSYYESCSSQCKTVAGYCAAASPPSYDGGCSSQCKTVAGYCAAAGPPSYYESCSSQCKTVAGYCAAAGPPSYYESCSSQCKTVSGYC